METNDNFHQELRKTDHQAKRILHRTSTDRRRLTYTKAHLDETLDSAKGSVRQWVEHTRHTLGTLPPPKSSVHWDGTGHGEEEGSSAVHRFQRVVNQVRFKRAVDKTAVDLLLRGAD